MSGRPYTESEVRRIANEFGHDLAAALLLASDQGGVSRALTRQMAQIVLDQIEIAVRRLKGAEFPDHLIDIYERGARRGVRDEFLSYLGSPHRRAA